jgi:hypothetical protein
MKKAFIAAVAGMLMLSSCMTTYRWNIGQSSSEFFTQNKKIENKLELLKQSSQWTVYRLNIPGQQPYFFYFKEDKLFQVDRGTRSPDLTIQSNSN